MNQENAITSFTARSVSFNASTMMLRIKEESYTISAARYHAISAICVRYMRERQTVMSALQNARRLHSDIERKNAVSNAIKYYEFELNRRMQIEVKELLFD
jgi:Ser/Thr protein kinase RdoA (MazF antagonist)